MNGYQFFDFLVIGDIATEFIIDLHNRSHPNVVGGSLLYSAGGLRCWTDRIALVSHTCVKHKIAFEQIQNTYSIDFQGVHFDNEQNDDRLFLGYISPNEVVSENPVAFYSSKNLTFPKELIGYSKNKQALLNNERSKYYPEDFPIYYRDISSALICPAALSTQIELSSILSKTSTMNLVIQSSPQYMKMSNFETIPVLMKDITAFITTSDQIRNLFRNRTSDLWEMTAHLCNQGCEFVVLSDEINGFCVYDHKSHIRIESPPYPNHSIDPTGVLDSFSGGFLAGYKKNYDPFEALTMGIVSASFIVEGSHPFYGADAVQGLQQKRMKLVKELIKII